MEQSKITEEHRALIGTANEPVTVQIGAEDARRMRDLLDDKDERWADGTGIAVPYAIAALSGYSNQRRLMPLILPNTLMTQQEWRFTRPFTIGEQLSSVERIVDIRDRLGGRYGYSILVTMATEFYDADGGHVASTLSTITQFDPAGAGPEGGSQ